MRLNSKREGKSFLLLRGGVASVSSLRFPWWDVMAGWSAGFDWLGGDRRGSADFELANHRQMPSALNITHVSLENKNLKRAKV